MANGGIQAQAITPLKNRGRPPSGKTARNKNREFYNEMLRGTSQPLAQESKEDFRDRRTLELGETVQKARIAQKRLEALAQLEEHPALVRSLRFAWQKPGEKEINALKQAVQEGIAARNEIFLLNRGLVHSMATSSLPLLGNSSFSNLYKYAGLPAEQLEADGNEALLEAIWRWNPKLGKLDTYAGVVMFDGMMRGYWERINTIKMNGDQWRSMSLFSAAIEFVELEEAGEDNEELEKFAQEKGVPKEQFALFVARARRRGLEWAKRSLAAIAEACSASLSMHSLDEPVGNSEDGDNRTLGNFISGAGEEDVTRGLGREDLRELLEAKRGELGEREQEVIYLRFFSGNGKGMTLDEIGEKFGLSRERVRQIESKALKKLDHKLRNRTGDLGILPSAHGEKIRRRKRFVEPEETERRKEEISSLLLEKGIPQRGITEIKFPPSLTLFQAKRMKENITLLDERGLLLFMSSGTLTLNLAKNPSELEKLEGRRKQFELALLGVKEEHISGRRSRSGKRFPLMQAGSSRPRG